MSAGLKELVTASGQRGENMEKAVLRKQILAKRNALPAQTRQAWDEQIFDRLVAYDQLSPCPVYLCYVSYRSEVDTKEFITWCLGQGKMVFVPKVLQESNMAFYRIFGPEDLAAGYQGILEPKALPENALSDWLKKAGKEVVSLRMLLPGAAFDKKGNRIGYGGGFYDRWLAKAGALGNLERIGLAYRMQVVENFPADSFDQDRKSVV